jgi:cysteine desulfurase / selenocysteine lyase
MTFDVARARRETPGCETVAHLNNAGAALPPEVVTDAVVGHLRREARIGPYEAADEAAERIEGAYGAIAELLGCDRDEIAFSENATRAWDMAFYSIGFGPGDRILTSRAEYVSNMIALLQVCRRTGAVVEVVDDDEHGAIDLDDLRARLDDRVKLVALTHVPTHGGLVNPAAEVGAIVRDSPALFLLDACQSVGQLPTRVAELGCDILSATGRKFLRGPRGTGFLYVRRSLIPSLEPPLLDLQAAAWTGPDTYEMRLDARRFETWEAHVAGRIGLGVAVEHALGWGLDAIAERVSGLAGRLRDRLAEQPGVTVHDQGRRRCGIVTFTVEGVPSREVGATLRAAGVNTSVSRADHAQLDLPERGLTDLVRASVHYYNVDAELERLIDNLPAPRP